MIDQSITTKPTADTDTAEVPDYLVREVIDGIRFYYRGYKSVLSGHQKLEEIMGISSLQSYLLTQVMEFIFSNLDKKLYKSLSNELGLHLSHKKNLSTDIGLFKKADLKGKLTDKYLEVAPLIAFEIDTKIESSNTSDQEYVHLKTEKLLDFGVQKVVWIFTSTKKVLIAEPKKDWLTKNWDQPITILTATTPIGELVETEDLLWMNYWFNQRFIFSKLCKYSP